MRQRRQLARSGLLLATLVVDADGSLAAEPQLTAKGVALNGGETGELWISLGAALRDGLAKLSRAARKNRSGGVPVHQATARYSASKIASPSTTVAMYTAVLSRAATPTRAVIWASNPNTAKGAKRKTTVTTAIATD